MMVVVVGWLRRSVESVINKSAGALLEANISYAPHCPASETC